MFSKNLKYYRLKNAMTKKALAEKSGLTPMAITNYENGSRTPGMEIINKLATILNVRVPDFLAERNDKLIFSHGEFRRTKSLSSASQEYIRESVEEYFGRFYSVIDILGDKVLPEPPACHSLEISGDAENDALNMRRHLGIAEEGPLKDLIGLLENKGILIYVCDIDGGKFSGMNGLVNDRSYIVINGKMSTERNRSTIAHELAHLMLRWPDDMDEDSIEKYATMVSGAFLFPRHDALRELGVHRSSITNDMSLVCQEYGISMLLLAKRAEVTHIVTKETARKFYMKAGSMGWRTNEPSRIDREKPELFEQLAFRAVSEEEISVQKGAELLHMPYEDVVSNCYFGER